MAFEIVALVSKAGDLLITMLVS
ncbi:hypothetical protein XBP1_2510012 [Xenorhabdus bovienii str. puntauvense]|uniref:Uncharacterized protein n=1 Tax=Xenorhabdus bovienii str. puntauvense TaxID=1398201 RepID=A0A077NHA8_XENBV|nr:hypothetical protein XBP1_2510012 [Xenorhabdus bovienii str. puntauvense]